MVRAVGDQVKAGNLNITSYTQEQMALTVDKINKSGADFGKAVDTALIAKVQGAGSDIARVRNEFVQSFGSATPDPQAAEKSRIASEDQANKANQLGDVTANLYDSTKKQQVLIESKLNPNLEKYVKILNDLNSATIATINTFLGLPGPKTPTDDPAYKKALRKMFGADDSDIDPALAPFKTYAEGGNIPAGKTGIAGERGPELISGPSSVLSTASTEKLIVALDAMREMKGERLGKNDFEWNVVMEQKRLATLKDRTSAFQGLDIKALEAELGKRPEVEGPMAKAREAMMVGEDQPTKWPMKEAEAKIDQTNSLLSELVSAMKQNVTQTSRVAMNTN
jgi:hypothetical protein